jgi:NTP pyrophosphatase (non-canonical NTP hydrolase)
MEYFENYKNFVDGTTSEISKNDDVYLAKFQELSAKLNGNFSRLDTAVAGLNGEAGEVGDLWKKVKYHGLEYTDEIRDEFIKELGDVCWYVCQTAIALDIPLEEVIDRNIEKLRKRHPHGFSADYMQQKKR